MENLHPLPHWNSWRPWLSASRRGKLLPGGMDRTPPQRHLVHPEAFLNRCRAGALLCPSLWSITSLKSIFGGGVPSPSLFRRPSESLSSDSLGGNCLPLPLISKKVGRWDLCTSREETKVPCSLAMTCWCPVEEDSWNTSLECLQKMFVWKNPHWGAPMLLWLSPWPGT